jgi:hypothetical protein
MMTSAELLVVLVDGRYQRVRSRPYRRRCALCDGWPDIGVYDQLLRWYSGARNLCLDIVNRYSLSVNCNPVPDVF